MNEKILKYAKDEDLDLKHSVDALSYAAIKTANLFSDIEPMRVIKFMLGDVPISGFTPVSYTHLTLPTNREV